MKIDLSVLHKVKASKPLYYQLKELLKGAIQSGIYKSGEQMESERDFISAGNLSYPTVSRAFRELADEGWIFRKIGAGTFVTDKVNEQNTSLSRVAILYYSTETPYFKAIFEGISAECKRYGITPVPVTTDFKDQDESKFLYDLKQRKIDGLLGYPSGSFELSQFFTQQIHQGFPMVILGTYFRQLPSDAVTFNNEEGSYQATMHLLNMGHRKIAFLGHIPRYPFSMLDSEIIEGMNRAFAEKGIKVDNSLHTFLPLTFDEKAPVYQQQILKPFKQKERERPTALICRGDGGARYVINLLRRNGFRIPEDISVVGFGDISIAKEVDPPLTTVKWPLQKAGKEAVRLLVSRMNFPDQVHVRIVMETELIIRQSTASVR